MRLPHDHLEVGVEIRGKTVIAGRLSASFSGGRVLGSTRFDYDRGYFGEPGAYPLDPKLPLGAGSFHSGEDARIFGAFQDLMPDDWGRRLIDADLAGGRIALPAGPAGVSSGAAPGSAPGSIGEFDYLALASDETRLGAIRFRRGAGTPWLGESPPAAHEDGDVAAIAGAASRFERHEATDADLDLLGAPGTSMGGARPKVTAWIDGALRIIKLPSERDRGIDAEAWEYVAILLAQRAGIAVQRGRLLRAEEGKSSLILDRFDRGVHGERIGYMSARTAMELGDQDHGTVTYEDLADAVDSVTLADRLQLRDLFKRVALSVLINNVDDHWKNHGFLRGSDSWSLSPAFDINPSRSRGVVYSRPISRADDPRSRDLRQLVATADAYALTRTDAATALGEVLGAVRAWPEVAKSAGIAAAEIAHMSAAFSEEQQGLVEREIRSAGLEPAILDLSPAGARGGPPARAELATRPPRG